MSVEQANKTASLRRRAEKLLAESPESFRPTELNDVSQLIHELAVYQAELELQNEELRETQTALQKARDRYAALYEQAPVGYVVLDASGIIRQANATWHAMLNRPEEDVRGRPFAEFIVAEDLSTFLGRFRVFFRNPAEKRIVVRLKRQGAAPFHAQIEAKPGDRGPDGLGGEELMVVVSDVSERWHAEEDLRRRESLLERIFELLPVGLWLADREGTLLRGNPAGVSIWGAEPRVPISEYGVFKAWRLPSREPVLAEEWALAKTVRHGVAITDEVLEIEAFDGKRKIILNYTAPVLDEQGRVDGAIVVNLDISERMALEERLHQSQKMESIGRLAGGVAHDFNNLIMGVMGYAELAREALPADHLVCGYLDEIISGAGRTANLTRQLLAFARRQTIAPVELDLNDAIAGLLKMLRRLIGEDIDLAWMPGANLWPVKLDPGQVDQVLANLCVNARDAIAGVGKVTIETANVSIDASYSARQREALPGDYVLCAVSDDGCGMDQEVLEHLFEPFFTTKAVGKGTGLGLATVFGIVKQNNGFINVYSEPARGTTFRLYLPRFDNGLADKSQASVAAPLAGGDETILLVEDEKGVRTTTAHFLRQFGYAVLEAEAPREALRLAAEHAGDLHLLLTDVVMPGMSGRELAVQLARTRPDMKALYMSGYTANVIAHRGILDEGVTFLAKPFSRDELAAKVRQVLDSPVQPI